MDSIHQISNIINHYIDEEMIAGASYSFIGKDFRHFYYDGVQGTVEPFDTISLNESMHYDLASLSKVVGTTTRILQMIEEKKLELTTYVTELLPDFAFSEIQIQHLLLHTSGLDADFDDKKNLNKENILLKINESNRFTFGETKYSDLGFIILGMIIEEVDDTTLEESFQKHIFKRLAMKQTSYQKNGDKEKYVPSEIHPQRGCIQGVVNDSKAYQIGLIGSAGLFSTLQNLTLFADSMLFDEILLTKQSKKMLLEITVDKRTYGWEKPFGNSILYHTGFTGTSICLDYQNKQGFILLTNKNFPNRKNDFLKVRKQLTELFLNEEKI